MGDDADRDEIADDPGLFTTDDPGLFRVGDTLHAELWYPRCEDRARYVIVGLVDVRAADDIRISYDFDRDGWVVEQASVFEWPVDDEVCDRGWKEVAFTPAGRFEGKERGGQAGGNPSG